MQLRHRALQSQLLLPAASALLLQQPLLLLLLLLLAPPLVAVLPLQPRQARLHASLLQGKQVLLLLQEAQVQAVVGWVRRAVVAGRLLLPALPGIQLAPPLLMTLLLLLSKHVVVVLMLAAWMGCGTCSYR